MKKIFLSIILTFLIPISIMLTGCTDSDKKYGITLDSLNNGNIYCYVSEAKEGEKVKLYYENIETGYQFLYFTLNGEQIDGDTFTMPSEDVTISAVINKIQYNISYHIDSDTTFKNTETPPTTYTIGSVIEIPDAVKFGYIFNGWYSDCNFNNRVNIIWAGMYGNLNLFPKFDIITYSINYYNVENSLHLNPTSYNKKTGDISLTNATRQDYEFKGWYDNKYFTGEEIKTIPAGTTGNINLYAKFISTKVDNEGYRLITSAIDFLEIIPKNLDGKYRVQGQISFKGYEYVPIGDKNNPFTGELDYVSGFLRDISITSMDEYTGLFRYIKNATITGISIGDIDIKISSNMGFNEYVGALAGYAENCVIDDVDVSYADIDARVRSCYAGSLIGSAKNSTISNCEICYSPIKILATQVIYAGGVCGNASNSTISKCCVEFKTSTNIDLDSQTQNGKIYCGGLVGESYKSTISNSYVWQENSEIKTNLLGKYGSSFVGGLVGYLGYTSSISNSYALLVNIKCYDEFSSTDYDGDMYLGGLVGKAYSNSSITNSFLTTFKDGSSRLLYLTCEDYKGFIVGNSNNMDLITKNYVDSEIYFVGGTSKFGDSLYITIDTLKSIKALLKWDTNIWIDFYGVNIGPILK